MIMADSLTNYSTGKAEDAVDLHSDSFEVSDFPQTLVAEKIIFVIDILLLVNGTEECNPNFEVIAALKSFCTLKKKISVKPVEFEFLLYNNTTVLHHCIKSDRDWKVIFSLMSDAEFEEGEQFLNLDKVFDKIATLIELPHPDCMKKSIPPNWVYHLIWFFNRNLDVPVIENLNSLNFLMMTPYVALDILYLCNNTLESNQCEEISQFLSSLNLNGKGYFIMKNDCGTKKKTLYVCLAQFLGHPLMRMPQDIARFNIIELEKQLNEQMGKSENNNNQN